MVKDLNWGKLEQRRKRSDTHAQGSPPPIAVPVYHQLDFDHVTSVSSLMIVY